MKKNDDCIAGRELGDAVAVCYFMSSLALQSSRIPNRHRRSCRRTISSAMDLAVFIWAVQARGSVALRASVVSAEAARRAVRALT